MDPIQNMELHKPQFTKNDMIIYETVMRAPEQVTYQSTNKLAEACGVSQPALSRFVKTLGYARYQDFRSDITAWVAQQHVSEDPNRLFYFEQLERLLRAAEQVLTDEYMRDLAHYVLSFDCIFATGIGKSLHPAMLLQGLSRKLHIFMHCCEMDALREFCDHMGPKDLLVVFTVSAHGEIMDRVRGCQGKILLVTTNVAYAHSSEIDRAVVLPFLPPDPVTCSVSPVLFSIFVELLVQYMDNELTQKDYPHA